MIIIENDNIQGCEQIVCEELNINGFRTKYD